MEKSETPREKLKEMTGAKHEETHGRDGRKPEEILLSEVVVQCAYCMTGNAEPYRRR